MKIKTCLLILLGLAGVLSSCDKSTLEDFDLAMGYEYYPLELGRTSHYAVDSIIFDPATFGIAIDTLSGFFREDIVDTLRDNSGELVYRIERFYRKKDTDPWQIHSVVSSSRGEREAVFTENNLRLIKLRFPLQSDVAWNSTAYFPTTTELEIAGESIEFFKGWNSTVLEQREAFEVAGQTFSDVYLVEVANFENKIEYRYGLEVYAPGKGLIYQELQVMDTQCEYCCNRDLGRCDPLPWIEKAEKGLILKKRLLQ